MENRYLSLNTWCKNTLGKKLYKIAIDAGFTCPTLDGRAGTKGCIFCSQAGSGDFAVPYRWNDPHALLAEIAIQKEQKPDSLLLGYFQAHTGTYAPISHLEHTYRSALEIPNLAGISIATRPDCLGADVLALLARLRKDYPDKLLWVELGLQSIHETTADYIRRGYSLSVFDASFANLKCLGIPTIVHIILGLPGESNSMVFDTIAYLNRKRPFGVKLQLLHVLDHTDLARDYQEGSFEILSEEAYLALLIECIERLHPDIVLHRVTGDGPKNLLIAPLWSRNKRHVLNELQHQMKIHNSYQGKQYKETFL